MVQPGDGASNSWPARLFGGGPQTLHCHSGPQAAKKQRLTPERFPGSGGMGKADMTEAESSEYLWDVDNPRGYGNAMGRYKTARELAFILEYIRGENLAILDVGGGSGRFAVPLANRGHRITVADISEEALK